MLVELSFVSLVPLSFAAPGVVLEASCMGLVPRLRATAAVTPVKQCDVVAGEH